MDGSATCFSEWEVVFGIVHPQYRVIVGAGYAALGWGALVQRAVLCLPAQKEREREGRRFTSATHEGNKRSLTPSVILVSGEQHKGKDLGTIFLLLGTQREKETKV